MSGTTTKQNRTPASVIKRFLPTLRRHTTLEGRKWSVDGQTNFVTLQEVIDHYGITVEGLRPWMSKPKVTEIVPQASGITPEMMQIISSIPLHKPEYIAAFKDWQTLDGSITGLVALKATIDAIVKGDVEEVT